MELTIQDKLLFKDEDFEEMPIKRRSNIFEPRTRSDFVKVMASVTKRPGKDIAILTSHWPKDLSWHYYIQSECKLKKTEVDKAKYINWFIKESKLK